MSLFGNESEINNRFDQRVFTTNTDSRSFSNVEENVTPEIVKAILVNAQDIVAAQVGLNKIQAQNVDTAIVEASQTVRQSGDVINTALDRTFAFASAQGDRLKEVAESTANTIKDVGVTAIGAVQEITPQAREAKINMGLLIFAGLATAGAGYFIVRRSK